MERFDSMDSNGSDYECCGGGSCSRSDSISLPFDPGCLENVILNIGDVFDLRVLMSSDRVKGALLLTGGLAVAGGLLGRHVGGQLGAAVGGAVGGACGLGIVAISMRDIWQEIKAKLSELFDIVYDYLAGMGINDYRKAFSFITQKNAMSKELAMVVVQFTASVLGKKVLSSLTQGQG
ncbi:hypothetical protein JYU34_005437 [Plutella xylostella]|uniref:Uncharacterized protein n=1 Tax=Plutella xylostella TaxID=51655 RepID=A0ABQ7QWP7_PLUXY|nr:uncharacterized protein LOC105386395 [Plutella xylostella]KAG7309469.1 hypothetical protein JYU34_005437 [Plutella xylostella]